MMLLIVIINTTTTVIYEAGIASIADHELLTMTLFGLGWVRHLNLLPEVRLPDGFRGRTDGHLGVAVVAKHDIAALKLGTGVLVRASPSPSSCFGSLALRFVQ